MRLPHETLGGTVIIGVALTLLLIILTRLVLAGGAA